MLNEYLDITDFDAAAKWAQDNGKADYYHSKQAICAYVAREAMSYLKRGIRINAICPGPTDTPLAQANADLWLSFAQDYRDETGSKVHTPEQMGDVMAFLNSEAACGVSGITMLVDSGHTMASMTGAYAPGKPIIDIIMGKVKL
jgi:NAD(P)-dependent dehydrogenase (short-subunit alcohol dehydrogenase family)